MRNRDNGLAAGFAGRPQLDAAVCTLGEARSLKDDGYAAVGTVGATGQVGDGKACGGSGKDGARRSHAVKQAEYFELRLKLVGDAIDGEIGIADGVFNGGDEDDASAVVGEGIRAELLAKKLLSVMQVVGHHVLKEHAKSAAGCVKRQPAAKWAGPDDSDSVQQRRNYLAARAVATSSAFGLA